MSELGSGKRDDTKIADALYAIADAIRFAARHLGKEEASSPMGAIEALGDCVEKGSGRIAEALGDMAEAMSRQHDC